LLDPERELLVLVLALQARLSLPAASLWFLPASRYNPPT